MENQFSRKDFLIRCFGAAGMFLGTSALLSSCGSGEETKPADAGASSEKPKSMVEQPGASGDCNDVTGVAEEEVKKREAVQYVAQSADPAKHCSVCQLYKAPEGGSACGGCTLFQGPVAADASCISFAPKVAS
ncbi:MAG: hypothetical protein BGN92_11630 [Sphingobacteriales bacterium 41-5]|nr:MAG: hypothetical protein BGN92_11630 [Sphingobacteriales bacterium 41-5]